MPRPRKVWTSKGINWKNAMVNASRRADAKRKKEQRERDRAAKQRERERAKAQRERERAAKQRERERAKAQRERERAAKQRERERAKTYRMAASAAKNAKTEELRAQKAIQQKTKKEQQMEEREITKKNNHLKRLNGLFLEYDIPRKFYTIDIKEKAYRYEFRNGLTTQSQFKKVTIGYLERNIKRIIEDEMLYDLTHKVKNYLNENFTNKFSDKEKVVINKEIKKFINEYKSQYKQLKPVKYPSNINSLQDLSQIKPDQLIKKSPDSFCKSIDEDIKKEIENLKSAASRKTEEARIIAEEKKRKEAEKAEQLRIQKEKEAEEKRKKEETIKAAKASLKKIESELVKSRSYIKVIDSEVREFKHELEKLSAAHKKAFLKGKYKNQGKALVKTIGNKIFPLFDEMVKVETILRNIQHPDESKVIGRLLKTIRKSNSVSLELDKLESAFKTNYKVIYKCGDQRLLNLLEASKYLEPEVKTSLISKIINKLNIKYSDSKNIMKLKKRLEQI
jgi:hypothetical protein